MQRTAEEILAEDGIRLQRGYQQGRHYSTCPFCAPQRKHKYRAKLKCLGVTIDSVGVKWGCNHCQKTGGGYFDKAGKRDGSSMVRGSRDQQRDRRGYGDLHRSARKNW